ncbi:unnamed protein product [Staurois parvus]|uniref:Uncharacterized protein n=1 Tax=Staurois parvus TaxID=386267 RepID=A0ABN9BRN6_9NEOB|nr:unnamed protein product [Staurois parvus]
MIQEMAKDCRLDARDGQRLQTIKEMVRLQTWYKRWSETANMIQEMATDCRHDTRDGQRLQI